jgi:hypothetical protein
MTEQLNSDVGLDRNQRHRTLQLSDNVINGDYTASAEIIWLRDELAGA